MKPASSTSSSDCRAVMRFLSRCIVLAVLVAAGQFVVYWWEWPGDIPPEVVVLKNLDAQNVDVLFLGDSTMNPAEDDLDRSSTPEMLQRLIPDTPVGHVFGGGYNLTLYEAIASYLADAKVPVKIVVFPINMRLVAPQLESLPYRYFDREVLFLRHDYMLFHVAYRPLASFKAFTFRSVRVEDFQRLPVLDGATNLGPVGKINPNYAISLDEEELARFVTFFYMYSLTRDSPALEEFGHTLDALNRVGILALPYVTPLDMERSGHYVGSRFQERIRENIALFDESADARGVQLLDLSEAVPGSGFIRGSHPDEHLRDSGRQFVADSIARRIIGP